MNKKIYFDTDCFYSFLLIHKEDILFSLYPGRVFLPITVHEELTDLCNETLRTNITRLINENTLKIVDSSTNDTILSQFREFTHNPRPGRFPIGKGEAHVLVLAIQFDGVIASNNMKDVKAYVHDYNLEQITTGKILCEALESSLLKEYECNCYWISLCSARRHLPTSTFSEYLNNFYRKGIV